MDGEYTYIISDKYTKEDVIEFGEHCRKHSIFVMTKARKGYPIEPKTTTELFDLWVKSKEDKDGKA